MGDHDFVATEASAQGGRRIATSWSMSSARKAPPVVSSRCATSSLPVLPRLPSVVPADLTSQEDATVVVATPSIGPRSMASKPPAPISGVRALTSRPPPPLPARARTVAAPGSALESSATTDAPPPTPAPPRATAEMFAADEPDLVFESVFPVPPLTRAFQLFTASALFVVYASTAALRCALSEVPRMISRALSDTRALMVQARACLRREWLRAAAAATEPRLRNR